MGLRVPKKDKVNQSVAYKRSPKQEAQVASRLGGCRTKGSGNGVEKGDVRVKGVARLELKTTSRKSFSITREMVQKIETAACGSGEMIAALEVEFLTDGKPECSVAVVPTWVLDILVTQVRNEKS